ncbi:MAG TPA: GGDEF domain-containing protein [Pseudomonadota bacterium]|nr:GGDEF domain-containing protein [Pseudomonadota bacterium]
MRAAYERERRLALTDPLTGASNRRFFVEFAQREIERLRRYGLPFSLCYLDLDNFKDVNDQYGHSTGDDLLRQLVQALASQVRASDLVARMGGDEFALLLPQTDAAGALAAVSKLRDAIDETMNRADEAKGHIRSLRSLIE